jgi:hypothetical protein
MLYEKDYSAWAESQAKALAEGRFVDLDLVNLADEVAGLSGSDKRAIKSRLAQLVGHLLKWQYQPGARSHSWRYTVKEQRAQIEDLLDESPSLRSYPETVLNLAHKQGVLIAARDTGLTEHVFSETRYTVEQLLDPEFYPVST